MDLSRLNISSLGRLGKRYKNLREFLAQVLEGERHLLDPKAEVSDDTPEFHRSDDTNAVKRDLTKLIASGRSDVANVFGALAPFFEVGFSLRREHGELKIESMFLMGRVFVPPGVTEPTVDFGLSDRAISGIERGRVSPLLKEANLENLSSTLSEADALAFEPKAGRVFVLVSDRPHPWQVGMIESVYFDVRAALASTGPVKAAPLRKFFR